MQTMFNPELLDDKAVERIETWAENLRSDAYLQGYMALRRQGSVQDRFCCLGVAADLFDPQGWDQGGPYGSHYGNGGKLTLDVRVEYALRNGEGFYVDDDDEARSLVEHNDHDKHDFVTIADIIESHLAHTLAEMEA